MQVKDDFRALQKVLYITFVIDNWKLFETCTLIVIAFFFILFSWLYLWLFTFWFAVVSCMITILIWIKNLNLLLATFTQLRYYSGICGISEHGRIQTQVRHECSIREVQDKDDFFIRVFQSHLLQSQFPIVTLYYLSNSGIWHNSCA